MRTPRPGRTSHTTGAAVVLTVALGVAVLAACRPPAPRAPALAVPAPALVAVERHPAFVDDGDRTSLVTAVRASIDYYARIPGDRMLQFGGDRVAVASMRAALEDFTRVLEAEASGAAVTRALEQRFQVYAAAPDGGVLYTGYYVPELDARSARDDRFRFPVLGRPADLVTASLTDFSLTCNEGTAIAGRIDRGRVVPYATRAEIEGDGGAGAPVLAWVADPVALFFLQIQGTGRLAFPDGSRRLVGFAASNGRPYVSIGKRLIDEGRVGADEASMQGIRRWIADHPEERDRILHANPRYVFFRPLAGEPLGSLGVPVTGGRSIATDPAVYPAGALAFVRVPGAAANGTDVLSRFVLSQDAGAAIRGPDRVDVFFGEGTDAEARAGRLRNRGELYFLAPRTAVH